MCVDKPNKIIKIPKPQPGELHSYFIASDWHDFHCHTPAVDILLSHAKDIPRSQRRLIINGDFLDLVELMSSRLAQHSSNTIRGNIDTIYVPHVEASGAWANDMLDRLQKTFDWIFFLEGNHDWRLGNFGDNYAPKEYRQFFNLKNLLQLDERNIRSIGYNDWLDIGDLSVTHGMYHGSTALLKHYNACGRNVVFGHVHQLGVRSFIRRGHTVQSWSSPCMSKLNPDYIKNSENNWSIGYLMANMKSNGHFNLNALQIWDDELVTPNGKLYRGEV